MARNWSLPAWLFGLSFCLFITVWWLAPVRSADGTVTQALLQARPAPESLPRPLFSQDHVLPQPVQGFGKPYEIAITFDDGPHPVHTKRLLAVLARYQVKATFFINGMWLNHGRSFKRNRDLVRRAHKEGHQIGNHTYSHELLTRLEPAEQTWQIVANEVLLAELLGGVRSRVFRPPYGQLTRHTSEILQKYGYTTVLWNIGADEGDLGEDPVAVARTVMMWIRRHGGGIVLLHDRNAWSVDAVELILAKLARQNCRRLQRGEQTYRIVPLDSFLRSPAESQALGAQMAAERSRERERLLGFCRNTRTRMATGDEQQRKKGRDRVEHRTPR